MQQHVQAGQLVLVRPTSAPDPPMEANPWSCWATVTASAWAATGSVAAPLALKR